MDINNLSIIGRLTKDPELKYTQSNKSVCSFDIAVNGFKKEDVSYFKCVSWGKTAETITQYVKKGHRIGLNGRLEQTSWTDKEGNKRYSVEIVVAGFQFLQPKSDSGPDVPADNPFSEDDLPF